MAPPRKIPKAELFATLSAMREAGNTCKEIAKKLGGVYSHRYIQSLCGMLSAIHITKSVDAQQVQKLGSRYDGSGAPVGNTTSPAASGSETGQLPDKGIS